MRKTSLFALLACTSIMWQTAYSEEKTADVEADEMNYLENEAKISAKGNVVIKYDNRELNANEVIYDQDDNLISAKGNIMLRDEDGNLYYAEQADFNDKMTKGTISKLNGKLHDKSLFAANKATRHSETLTELENAVYSPCKVCKKKMNGNPLWQLSASNIKFDEEAERIAYKNATFDIYGVPVFYMPYFFHAMPDAKRESGLLLPTYSSMNTLGVTVKTPYYINIAPNMDATIEPLFTTEEGIVLSGNFRHLTRQGQYSLSGSITNPQERDEFGVRTSSRDIRGHIEGKGHFNLNDTLSWGFDGKRTTDDTYLQRYKFDYEDLLISQAYIENIDGRDYIGARAVSFQGLNALDDPGTTPLALPMIDAHFERNAGYKNSRWLFDANSLVLSRDEGVNSRRISGAAAWNIPYITKNGQVLDFKASIRGDAYSVENVQTGSTEKDGLIGRLIPEINLNWKLPLASFIEKTKIFLEPIVNFIVSPNGGNPDKIPNEDSQELELSDINLFTNNHFTGYDRVESGARTNYGLRGGIENELGKINFMIGQNYQANANQNFTEESGLNDNFSDYTGRLTYRNKGNFDISYRFRLDKDDFIMRRNEFDTSFRIKKAHFNLGYTLLDERNEDFDKHEFNAATSLSLTDNWSINANGRRNMEDDGGWIHTGAGVVYEDECLRLDTRLSREFTRDRDIEPSSSVIVKVSFKNIGSF